MKLLIVLIALLACSANAYEWATAEDATCTVNVPLNTPFNMNVSQTFIGYGDLYFPYPNVVATVPQYWKFDAERGFQHWQLTVGEYLVTPERMYVKEYSEGFNGQVSKIRANYAAQIATYSFLPKIGSAVHDDYGRIDIYGGGSNSDNAACGLLQPATIFVKPCSGRIVMLAETTIRPLTNTTKASVGARFYATMSIAGTPDQSNYDVAAFTGGVRWRDMIDYCRVVYRLDDARFCDYLTLPSYVWPIDDNCFHPNNC